MLTHWHFYLSNIVLAALIYLLLARLVISLALPADNALARYVRFVTDPLVKPVAALTPRVVPAPIVVGFAITWLLVARIILSVTGPTG